MGDWGQWESILGISEFCRQFTSWWLRYRIGEGNNDQIFGPEYVSDILK
jgi:hypothetical protein